MALSDEAANMAHDYTGGFDGLPSLPIAPVFGVFEFNPLYANTNISTRSACCFVCFAVRAHAGLFAVRPEPHRHPRKCRCACMRSARRCGAGSSSATPSRRRSPASPAALWAQTNAYVNLSALDLDRAATVLIVLILGGYGRLYGAFIGAVVYLALEHFLAQIYPTAWQLGLGLLLVLIALFARNGILGLGDDAVRSASAALSARRHDRDPARDAGAEPPFRRAHRRAATSTSSSTPARATR